MTSTIDLPRHYDLWIDGGFTPPLSGKTFPAYNPATGEKLADIAAAEAADVDKAVKAAWKAFPDWAAISSRERSDILLAIAKVLEDHFDFLVEVETLNNGKPLEESRWDVWDAIDEFRYFASCIRAEEGSYIEHSATSFNILRREPIGVVAQIVPWNYPLCMGCWKLAPALAAGDCIVFKPASNTPISVLELARLIGPLLPPGVLNILPGGGRTCGEALVQHPDIRKVAFTGSTEIGARIGEIAGKNVIPSTLELGGKSAHIIFPDCQWERALGAVCMGIICNAGQVCSAGSRLFLHRDIYDEFLADLVKKFQNIKVGNGLDPETKMGPVIDENQMKTILHYIDIGVKEGARLATGGKRILSPPYDKGHFIEPTILADADNRMRVAQEEIFGPVLVVIPFSGEQEVIDMANDSLYGLAGGVWTQDINRGFDVAKGIETGTVWINEFGPAPAGSAFGGYKKSGYGREVHKQVLEHYSQVKNIYISTNKEPDGIY